MYLYETYLFMGNHKRISMFSEHSCQSIVGISGTLKEMSIITLYLAKTDNKHICRSMGFTRTRKKIHKASETATI